MDGAGLLLTPPGLGQQQEAQAWAVSQIHPVSQIHHNLSWRQRGCGKPTSSSAHKRSRELSSKAPRGVTWENSLSLQQGHLQKPTSALPAAAGAGPGGARARPAHPPAAELSWAPSAPALRPPVSKLLNLRAAHALRGQRPTRRIGPLGRPGPALLSAVPRSGRPLPGFPPALGLSFALGSSGAPSR